MNRETQTLPQSVVGNKIFTLLFSYMKSGPLVDANITIVTYYLDLYLLTKKQR